ncbi:TonB family protein [Phycisphaerales bacterium AB-hyl4]|uniref:TonB family protein n=1 Tax=Natronomicrosphaera hydrolytica TaxID=3242702 RepID=A0ABV4U375_9BACT
MSGRGSNRVLVICAAVAVLVHAGVLAWPTLLSLAGRPTAAADRGREPTVDRPLPERDVELGRPESRTPSVAWISYDDYRELVAPRATTEQPALQQEVDPADEAPLEMNPTPPAPTAADDASAEPAELAELDEPPLDMEPEAEPPALPEFDAVGELPPPDPEAQPTDEVAEPDRAPAESAQQADAASASPDARPTAAPRSDAEADATQLDPRELEWRTGRVIVGPGIEIRTARPQLRASLRTAFPRNPTVRIYFNAQGSVDRAEVVRSTGYADWDGTILTSLYRWRAEGEQIDAADPHVVIQIQYLLHDHPD